MKKYKLIICFNRELVLKYKIVLSSILKDIPPYLKQRMTQIQYITSIPYVRFLNLTQNEFKELISWIQLSPYRDLFYTVFYLFKDIKN